MENIFLQSPSDGKFFQHCTTLVKREFSYKNVYPAGKYFLSRLKGCKMCPFISELSKICPLFYLIGLCVLEHRNMSKGQISMCQDTMT